jgi:hypothetical protein
MKLRPSALIVVLTAIMIVPTSAQDAKPPNDGCPSIGLGTDGTVKAVELATSCGRAFEIMKQCSMAGGADGSVGYAVREKCETQFVPTLSAKERKTYQRELKRCIDKYANREGSLYASRTAFCQTEHAVKRATRHERRG